MNPCCDVIIPVYNAPEWLELCVDAVFASDKSGAVDHVILLDDGSAAKTQKLIRALTKKYPKIISVRNGENLGFVKTCNRGMQMTGADYIMLLNSDCLLASDSTARMIDFFKHNPTAGLICPLSNNAANLSVPIPKGANYIQVDRFLGERFSAGYYPACTIVGNCMIITRACYNAVGGLDEAFGVGYGEETDYQFRAAEAGFDAIIANNVYVFHKAQASFGESEKLNERKQKNRDLFFSRWGEQYKVLLKRYKKNNPASAAKNVLAENDERIAEIGTEMFSDVFLRRLDELNHIYPEAIAKYSKSDAAHGVFQKALRILREQGLRALAIKTFRKLFGVESPGGHATHHAAPAGVDTVLFKDLIIVYSGEVTQRIKQLQEALDYSAIHTDIILSSYLLKDHLKWYRGCLLVNVAGEPFPNFFDLCKEHNKVVFADVKDNQFQAIAGRLDGVFLQEQENTEWWSRQGVPTFYMPCRKTDEELALELDEIQAEMTVTNHPLALREFVRGIMPKAIGVIAPHLKPAGGIVVMLEHLRVLQSAGYDAFAINLDGDESPCIVQGKEIWVLNGRLFVPCGFIDKMVATMWNTVRYLDLWQIEGEKYYLVQGQESLLYSLEESELRRQVCQTYQRRDLNYITVSEWCRIWLREDYGSEAQLVQNGLCEEVFPFRERTPGHLTTVLIEGNCGQKSKNMDEAFRVVEQLDRENYRIILMTNYGEPAEWYNYDKIYRSVPYTQVHKVYQEADILLKTSLVESFSYPPLEMMATGGCVVAILNSGNQAYLENEYNCLTFSHGDPAAGAAAIERLRQNSKLRKQLIDNGQKTAKAWGWDDESIVFAYENGTTTDTYRALSANIQ